MTSRRIRRFALHYGEMVAAMLIGMAVLWPVWLLATGAAGDGSWLRSVSVETLVMATTMALPMAGWMRVRARARQKGVELPMIISDHADWDDLQATIREVEAGEIWVTHGEADALVHWCGTVGLRAKPLHLVGYGDEGEPEADGPPEEVASEAAP